MSAGTGLPATTGAGTGVPTTITTGVRSAACRAWLAFLLPTEGTLSLDPTDPGNWTSGQPGVGRLVGTKYGIAASAHPGVDIANLTLDGAQAIAVHDYHDAIHGDLLPGPFAFMVSDAAFGSGPEVAAKQFQAMLGVPQDGDIGVEVTVPALLKQMAQPSRYGLASGMDDLLCEYASRRLLFESNLGIWSIDKGGWTRRLFHSVDIARSLPLEPGAP